MQQRRCHFALRVSYCLRMLLVGPSTVTWITLMAERKLSVMLQLWALAGGVKTLDGEMAACPS